MVNYIKYPVKNQLVEAFQSNDMRFAFVNKSINDKNEVTFSAIHDSVKCREYFNELLMLNHHPTEFKYSPVYGFKYNIKDYPLDLSATRIALHFTTVEQANQFKENLSWLHTIEDANGVDNSIIYTSKEDNSILIIEGSKMWVTKCLLTNVYTLLLKLMTYPQEQLQNLGQPIQTYRNSSVALLPSEFTYINTIGVDTFNNVLTNCTVIADIPSKYVDGSDKLRNPGTIHASSGILYIHQQLQNFKNYPEKETTFSLKNLSNVLKSFYTDKVQTQFLKAA